MCSSLKEFTGMLGWIPGGQILKVSFLGFNLAGTHRQKPVYELLYHGMTGAEADFRISNRSSLPATGECMAAVSGVAWPCHEIQEVLLILYDTVNIS